MIKTKITTGFLYSLALISIVGFLGIIAEVWLGFDLIVRNASAWMLIILGIGLAVEGQVRNWNKFKTDGYSSTEVAHIVTGLLGFISITVGILDLIGLEGPTIMSMKGIVSVVAIVIIVLQTFFVE